MKKTEKYLKEAGAMNNAALCFAKEKILSKPRPYIEKMMQKEDGSKAQEEDDSVLRNHFEKLHRTFNPTTISYR